MNIEKYVKKDIILSIIFILIGIIAGITGFVFNFHKEVMTGLVCGFLPTGIGTLIINMIAKNNPKMRKNIELENEERNRFINTKAGHTAFWICYSYIFIAAILYNIVHITFLHFLIVTIIFMPVVYFLLVFLYHKKY
jgi:hypothetical protein